MSILHVASHGMNVGDGAIIQAMNRLMPKPVVKADVVLEDAEVLRRRILRSDNTIMGGGGAISNPPQAWNGCMVYPLKPGDIKEGMAFVALGYNHFYDQEYSYFDELKDFIQACYDNNVPFSVRNDGSKEIIEEGTGLEIVEIPDPGMFVLTDDNHNSPCIKPGKKNVVFQFAGDANRDRVYKGKVIESLVLTIIGLAFKYDANIILAPHTVYDVWPLHQVYMQIRKMHFDKLRDRISVTPIVHPAQADKYFRIYKQADVIVGMRGHSVICGVGLGKPTIAIDSHPKVVGFMKKMGLEEYTYRWQDGFYQIGQLIENPEKYPNLIERVWNEEYPKFRDFMKEACHGSKIENGESVTGQDSQEAGYA